MKVSISLKRLQVRKYCRRFKTTSDRIYHLGNIILETTSKPVTYFTRKNLSLSEYNFYDNCMDILPLYKYHESFIPLKPNCDTLSEMSGEPKKLSYCVRLIFNKNKRRI